MTVSKEEAEERKRVIYESLSVRNRKYIDRIGYAKWDPFAEPKDPIEIRRDPSRRTSQQLVREFLQSRPMENYSNAYGQGVLDICLGIINEDDRYIAMLEFATWYNQLLEREGKPRG